MKSTRKKDIRYGDEDLLESDEFDSKHGKQRISLMVDMQVVEAFKNRADSEGEKYQVLMRKALKESVFGSRVDNIEERLRKIESAIFKKAR